MCRPEGLCLSNRAAEIHHSHCSCEYPQAYTSIVCISPVMPRKQPAAPQTSSEVALDGNESYLDNFLNSVIDEANLPGELKRYLGQLRELDTQSQELFERMQRLSKNHIAKAKRSVQDGREPDEEYLAKARRTYRELVDIDEEKVSLAEQMHVEVTKHFSHCSSELRKFEEELKEKGQLKTPQMKTQLARQDSASNDADAAGAASSFAAAGDALPLAAAVAAGRRGRQGSMGGTGSGGQPEQPTSANSHKRGRGRKVSFKEAERQRAVAEAMAEERVAPPPSVQGFHYNDSELPVAPREECNLPLCGAVPAAPDYMIPDGSKVSTNPAVPLSLVPAVPLSLVPSSRCSRALWRAPPRRWHAHLITQPSLLIPLDGSPHHASAPLDADTGGSLFATVPRAAFPGMRQAAQQQDAASGLDPGDDTTLLAGDQQVHHPGRGRCRCRPMGGVECAGAPSLATHGDAATTDRAVHVYPI